jgi:hypothetical protein
MRVFVQRWSLTSVSRTKELHLEARSLGEFQLFSHSRLNPQKKRPGIEPLQPTWIHPLKTGTLEKQVSEIAQLTN